MPIRTRLAEQCAFEPDAIKAMSTAFDEACAALRLLSDDEHARAIIAIRIVDLARSGVVDAEALRDRVISEARVSFGEPLASRRYLEHVPPQLNRRDS